MNARPLEIAVAPLDVVRGAALRLATRSALLTRVLGRRDSRLACLATFQVVFLFALALRAPVALFFLGPALFGVIHLAADVRYLVLRRAPPMPLVAASVGFAAAITVVRVLVLEHALRVRHGDQIDVLLGLAWIAVALFVSLGSRLGRLWLTAGFFAFVMLGALLVTHARTVGLVLVHGHNVVALVAWLVLFRRRRGWAIVPLTVVVLLSGVLLSGAYLPWTEAHDGLRGFGVRAEALGAWLAPGLAPGAAVLVVSTFVFLQGVHYATWTGWIPQDDLRGEGTPTFRMTVRSLVADFGPVAFTLVAMLAIAFAAASAWDIRRSLGWYMTLAKSHAWFECAFLAYFVTCGPSGARPAGAFRVRDARELGILPP